MNPLSSILLAATGIAPDRSATFTSTVVIAGIVIVLGILVLLIFVCIMILTGGTLVGLYLSAKKPVKNPDLWKRLIAAKEPHDVTFLWVKGHAGHKYNERCDELATVAADKGPRIVDTGFVEGDAD